jgi:carbon storage regulator CsrA
MLILSRKPGETILIDGPARITVVSRSNASVKLGITAASDVQIAREEVASIDLAETVDRSIADDQAATAA